MNANVRSDWFINTVDPYPFFSAVAKSIYDWFGIDGFRVFALLGTLVAMASVFWLAHLLAKQADHPNAAPLATVAVGLTLPLHINAFEGVGGQYIVSVPAYLQPSMFGCLVLLAIPCLVASRTTNNRNAKTLLLTGAFVLATLGCALHPTYMVSALILLAAAFIANVWQSGKVHILYFMVAAALLTAVAVAANPALLSMAVSSPEYSRAVQKFAFERIPQHTKLTGWRYVDIARFLVMLAAIPIAAEKLKHPWLARFLAGSLAIGTTATLVVQVVGSAKLALLFPWRVSVFIVPMSVTVLAVWAASYIEQKAPLWNWRRAVIVLASFVALYGGIGALLAKSPAETDERTALIKAVHPSGVGLVPVDSDNLRLNASTNIYVDWKSPPYAGPDLIEWWRRIDQMRRVEGDAEQFCSVSWHASIQWMLLPAKANAPSCVSKWRVIGQTKNWRVLGVPPLTPRTSISFRAAVSSATLTISRNSQWYRYASVEAVH
jgi:hypothetical protein